MSQKEPFKCTEPNCNLTFFHNHCNKCKCVVIWKKNIPKPNKDGEFGWWVEALTKQVHWNRCDEYKKNSSNSMKPSSESAITGDSAKVATKAESYKYGWLQDEEVDAIQKMARESYDILKAIELELKEESNPARIGMIFNQVCENLRASKREGN